MMKAEALNGIGIGNFYSYWHMLFTPRGNEINVDAPNILDGSAPLFGNKFVL